MGSESRPDGFTLLELVLAALVLGILALVVVPRLSSTDPHRLDLVAEEVAAALRFARSEALRTAEVHGARVVPPPGLVSVFKADLSGGGVAVGSVLAHPLTGQPYRFRLDALPHARGAALRNATAPFAYAGLGGSRADVLFDAEGHAGFVEAGGWRPLSAGTVQLRLGRNQRDVVLSPLGRVTLP